MNKTNNLFFSFLDLWITVLKKKNTLTEKILQAEEHRNMILENGMEMIYDVLTFGKNESNKDEKAKKQSKEQQLKNPDE